MRKNRLYLTIALVLTIAVSLVIGVYSFFTDYQVKTLQAHSGVSLELKKDEGISSVQQSGYIVKKDGAGWYDAGTDATIKAEVKIGYEFDGWYNGNNKISSNADDIYTVNDYTVLTAKSKPIIYKITYDLVGGELPEGKTNPPTYTITSDTITLNNPTKDGYTFKGWIGSNGDTPETTVTIPTGSTGDKHYTAVWEEIEYNITYDLDGGALPSGKTNPAKYKVTSPDITLNNPERTGYTFLGWTGTELTGSTEPILTSASVNLKYNADNNDCMTTLDSAISLVAGEKYKVTWDNKEYEVECKLHPEMGFPYIGNITLFNDASGTNTGEPFMIVSAKAYNQTMIVSGDTANTTHTVAVVAKKFDNPVTIPTGSTGDRHYVAHWRAISAILMEGGGIEESEGFNYTVPSNATAIVFTDEVAPANATLTDVSFAQDDGVVAWLDGTTYKVSTQRPGVYVKAPDNADYILAFYSNENITSIDLSMLDTSETSSMGETFDNNYNLQTISFGDKWDVSNVERFHYTFSNCRKLTSLDLSNWNTSKATYMDGMFNFCTGLETITFGKDFNTSNNESFYQMFYGCTNLKAIDVSGFDTSKAYDFGYMFADCANIKELDISNFDTSKVSAAVSNSPGIQYMFDGMVRLERITLGAKFSFNGEGLTEKAVLPTPDATYITDKNVDGKWYNTETNVGYAPADVPSKTAATYTVDAPQAIMAARDTWYKGSVDKNTITKITFRAMPTTTYAGSVARAAPEPSKPSLPIPKLDETWDASAEQNGSIIVQRYGTELYINDAYCLGKIYANEDSSSMFSRFSAVTSISGLELLDTSNVTYMSSMFGGCSALTSIGDLSGWNTTKVSTMSSMFNNCSALTSLDLSGFNTSNVTSMSSMFVGCSALTSIGDLSGWNTQKVTDMSLMFYNCGKLTSLNLSGWNTTKVSTMSSMFSICSALTSLDLSGFNTSNVTSMSSMFNSCTNLKIIYVGTGWNTSKATTTGMFTRCGTSSVTYKSSTASLSLDEETDEPVDTTTLYWQSIVDKMFEGTTELTLNGEVTEMPLDVIDAVGQLENAVTFTWNDKVFVISQETINDFEYVPGTPISIAELAETYTVKADSTDSIEEVDENVENTDSEIVDGSNSDSETEPTESTNEDEPVEGSTETEPIAAESENAVEAATESSPIDDSTSVGDTDSIAIANTSLLLMMLQYRIL